MSKLFCKTECLTSCDCKDINCTLLVWKREGKDLKSNEKNCNFYVVTKS